MRHFFQRWLCLAIVAIVPLGVSAGFGAGPILPAETLSWNTNRNRVSADIKSRDLRKLLEQIAAASGWRVYLEPGTTHQASAKFDDLPPGEALRLLLGSLNFALVSHTNDRPRLYVFRTSQSNATQLIQPPGASAINPSTSIIPNQIVVRLKPGVRIEDLARKLGAKVVGRIDALNLYCLEFDDASSTQAAREAMLNDADVDQVDSNFSMNHPEPVALLPAGAAPEFNLKPRTNSGNCQIIVGLIDTAFQSLGGNLDSFLLPSVSVAGEAPPATELTHGPAMAETLLRSLQIGTGGSSSAKILPVDVYGPYPETTSFNVAKGIYQAVNAGANIVNLSLGSDGDSPVLHDLIRKASQQGVVFFGAAGNQPTTSPTYPAAYPEVVAVTAGDRAGQIAPYANRGDFVDIMAPGTSVVPYQGQSYLVSGTSAATAFASGLAAGLADANRNCPDQVLALVRAKLGVSAKPSP
jgi:hypothetical protein